MDGMHFSDADDLANDFSKLSLSKMQITSDMLSSLIEMMKAQKLETIPCDNLILRLQEMTISRNYVETSNRSSTQEGKVSKCICVALILLVTLI